MTGDIVVRLSQLLSALCANADEGLDSEKLAALYGVTTDFINQDLELLSTWFPISCEPEDAEDFKQPRTWYYIGKAKGPGQLAFRLSVKDAMELLSSLEVEEDPVILQLREKVLSALFGSEKQGTGLKTRRLVKGGKSPFDELQPSSIIYELAQCCGKNRLIIEYTNQKGERSKRSVDPLGLVYCWATGAWYLIAYSLHNKEIRNFRIERISSCQRAGSAASYQDFCLKDYLAYAWGAQVTPEKEKVKVRFYDEFNVITRVERETQGRPARKLERQDDGTWIYTDLVSGLNEFRVWLRSFGASAEVLEPKKLRDELIESYRRILARYK